MHKLFLALVLALSVGSASATTYQLSPDECQQVAALAAVWQFHRSYPDKLFPVKLPKDILDLSKASNGVNAIVNYLNKFGDQDIPITIGWEYVYQNFYESCLSAEGRADVPDEV